MTNTVKAWSFSALKLYEECPAKYKYEKIDKLPKQDHPAMARGREIHKQAEDFLTGDDWMVPPPLSAFSLSFKELREFRPMVEQQWAFTERWKPTGWFAKDCWLRVVVDAAVLYDDEKEVLVVDHKTGKKWGDNSDQMDLFGAAAFCMFPGAETVDTRLWYLDSGDEDVALFGRKGLADQKREWEARVEPLFNDTKFLPRPTKKCNWCDFSRARGGPCKYS